MNAVLMSPDNNFYWSEATPCKKGPRPVQKVRGSLQELLSTLSHVPKHHVAQTDFPDMLCASIFKTIDTLDGKWGGGRR